MLNYLEILEAIQNNQILMSEELNILETIWNKYKLNSLGKFAKENNISDQTIMNRKKAEKQSYITLSGTDYYFN